MSVWAKETKIILLGGSLSQKLLKLHVIEGNQDTRISTENMKIKKIKDCYGGFY